MIRPPGQRAAFSEASDGDLRHALPARAGLSRELGISGEWATVRQVHGAEVIEASDPGDHGAADALWTSETGLPVAVFTADCFGVVLLAADAVGVAHAGWRGAQSGVVSRLRDTMAGAGHEPDTAAIGPGIGACCFEVGLEVAALFPAHRARTSWGTASVDLAGSIGSELEGLDVWLAGRCTYHDDGWFSHRRDQTRQRLATIAWI